MGARSAITHCTALPTAARASSLAGLCPQYTKPLGEKLRAAHGSLTAEHTIRQINALVQTGDLHVAIYEASNQRMYVAQGRPSDEADGKLVAAYDSAYSLIDVKELLAVPRPSVAKS